MSLVVRCCWKPNKFPFQTFLGESFYFCHSFALCALSVHAFSTFFMEAFCKSLFSNGFFHLAQNEWKLMKVAQTFIVFFEVRWFRFGLFCLFPFAANYFQQCDQPICVSPFALNNFLSAIVWKAKTRALWNLRRKC